MNIFNVQISKLELYKYCCLTIFKTISTLGDILIYTRLGETPCTLCMSKLPQIGLRPRFPPPTQSPPSPKTLYCREAPVVVENCNHED